MLAIRSLPRTGRVRTALVVEIVLRGARLRSHTLAAILDRAPALGVTVVDVRAHHA